MVNRRWMVGVIVVVSLAMCLSACEPLRKKFTRKKKASLVEDAAMVPVLEPEEYPTPEENPMQNYQQHYAMVRVFYKDLWRGIDENINNKSIKFAIDQVMLHLAEMKKMLVEEKQTEITKLQDALAYYEKALDQNAVFRNKARIASDLRSFYHQLLRACKPNVLKGSYIKVMPADEKSN